MLFCPDKQSRKINSIVFECYKALDNRINLFNKNYTRKLLLSVFGWKFGGFVTNSKG